MKTESHPEELKTHRGSLPSCIEYFSIKGLYGYRDLSFSSSYSATILIAKNGAGKTTLLGALDAFLKREFVRLIELPFSTINCKLRDHEEVLSISRDDILRLAIIPDDKEFIGFVRRFSVDPSALVDYIDYDYKSGKLRHRPGSHEIYDKISSSVGYSWPKVKLIFDSIEEILNQRSPKLVSIRKVIDKVIGDTEIVYLPTYRRIELPIPVNTNEDRHYKQKISIQSRLGLPKKSLFNADIQFGLADISERLSDLNQEILFKSNQGYREISANIINELLDGSFENEITGAADLPDKESLQLFFSRLKEGSRRVGSFQDVVIPNIDRIYDSGQIPMEANRFLQYFLRKLNTVINATNGIEATVEEFINNCNNYLSSSDESTTVEGESSKNSLSTRLTDDKLLKLDRKTLSVHVDSIAANRKVPLNSLSSGEKQMISLFARLYLYQGPKIVLIDEPELSLSIGWQRKILMDVVNASSCTQVIAITHSPFVFDNELEPYAKVLSINIMPNVAAPDIDIEEASNEL